MIDLPYTAEALPAVWPGPVTPEGRRKRSQFSASWTKATALLSRELAKMKARNVRIAVDVRPASVRADGQLRADAKVHSSGVIVSFDTEAGRLAFPCDTFNDWMDNIYAVALSLEALRMVDRYGVQTGKQYTGFKAIPAFTAPTFSTRAAAEAIAVMSGEDVDEVFNDRNAARRAVRAAKYRAHPDTGGSVDAFNRIQTARVVLEAHHGGPL